MPRRYGRNARRGLTRRVGATHKGGIVRVVRVAELRRQHTKEDQQLQLPLSADCSCTVDRDLAAQEGGPRARWRLTIVQRVGRGMCRQARGNLRGLSSKDKRRRICVGDRACRIVAAADGCAVSDGGMEESSEQGEQGASPSPAKARERGPRVVPRGRHPKLWHPYVSIRFQITRHFGPAPGVSLQRRDYSPRQQRTRSPEDETKAVFESEPHTSSCIAQR
jgi:hypothetical protein